jgi:hypothetical protein
MAGVKPQTSAEWHPILQLPATFQATVADLQQSERGGFLCG